MDRSILQGESLRRIIRKGGSSPLKGADKILLLVEKDIITEMKATVKNSRFYYGVVIKYIPVICRKEDQTMTQHFNDDIQRQIDEMDLNSPPPIEEPRRQYWFIKKCREIVKRKSEEMGRPLSACTVNMGCQMITEHGTLKSR